MGCNPARLPFHQAAPPPRLRALRQSRAGQPLALALALGLAVTGTPLAAQPGGGAFRSEQPTPRCSDEVTALLQTRLNRARKELETANPKANAFELESQQMNLVVREESLKALASRKYKCDLELQH
jgi:hypothetical protein